MAMVVTGRCVDCCYTDCVTVCPVDCFYRIEDPAMLVIDPEECIDCGACVPVCPVQAIYLEDEVPEVYVEYIALNAERCQDGENITAEIDPLPTAIDLDAVHGRERARGWDVVDP